MVNVIQFFKRTPYRREITGILILKIIGLVILWKLCFSHRLTENITPAEVSKLYLSQNN